MHVSGRIGAIRACRRSSGFSLVEVVVASGLLLMTITAVTFCVTSVSASGARLQGVMDADRAVRLVAERLAAVPFYGSECGRRQCLGLRGRRSAGCRVPPRRRDAEHADRALRALRWGRGARRIVRDCLHRGRGGRAVRRALPRRPRMDRRWSPWPSRAGLSADGDQPPGCALSVRLTATSHGTSPKCRLHPGGPGDGADPPRVCRRRGHMTDVARIEDRPARRAATRSGVHPDRGTGGRRRCGGRPRGRLRMAVERRRAGRPRPTTAFRQAPWPPRRLGRWAVMSAPPSACGNLPPAGTRRARCRWRTTTSTWLPRTCSSSGTQPAPWCGATPPARTSRTTSPASPSSTAWWTAAG